VNIHIFLAFAFCVCITRSADEDLALPVKNATKYGCGLILFIKKRESNHSSSSGGKSTNSM